MRRILHLSDLHFGRADAALVRALGAIAHELDPQVIAVSGDLTQRARTPEFVAARQFLDALPAVKVIVPGNHDVPLYNVIERFVAPLARYRRHIASDIEPVFADAEIVVVGVNTARSLTFKRGRINRQQVARASALFCAPPLARTRVLVTHHPFDLPAGKPDADDVVGRASMAMSSLRECPPDLLLAGHVHVHGTATTAERYDIGGHVAIVVQAGTATSTRTRGGVNSFNVIEVDPSQVTIDHFRWSGERCRFAPDSTSRFVRRNGRWERLDHMHS